MSKIVALDALEILDSRGNPTLEVMVRLESGAAGIAKVPAGASTGKCEAVELRDGDRSRYRGLGVQKVVRHVREVIQPAVKGIDPLDLSRFDHTLIELDGTPNKARLGANAILGVSIAALKATAAEKGVPLYRHLAERGTYLMPVPMVNVLNGGRHADNSLDFQEFMIAPVGAPSFSEGLRAASETFHTLRDILRAQGYETGVGDEGGLAPRLRSNDEAMDLLYLAIQQAGYKPGTEIAINLDPAASEFFEHGTYIFRKSGHQQKTSAEMIALWLDWVSRYSAIFSLEDGLSEEDWPGWQELTKQLGGKVQLVGDDIFVTNRILFEKGIRQGIANSILIKLNQIGTVTEALECVQIAQKNDYGTVVSHRSGETDDTTIADFAVATGAGQIKAGSVCRGERTAKYNRLLEIEHELGRKAIYAGRSAYAHWQR
jgi:enolase